MSKAYSTIIVVALVAQFGCQAGQVAYRTQVDRQRLAASGWPDQIAGRNLRDVTDEYALYANNSGSAEELKRWLDLELKNFRSDESDDSTKLGLVLAIEAGEDPLLLVEQWRKDNVNRARLIAWTSPIRNQVFNSPDGRPYSWTKRLYFRESFSMPSQEATRLGILDIQDPRPAWICFLATDQHLMVAFNKLWKQYQSERYKGVPFIARVVSFPSDLIMGTVALFIIPQFRSIDIELMHLQRREALNHTLIEVLYEDGLLRTERLKNLRDATDRTWKDIWVRRPID